jgi:hypothetical protein
MHFSISGIKSDISHDDRRRKMIRPVFPFVRELIQDQWPQSERDGCGFIATPIRE